MLNVHTKFRRISGYNELITERIRELRAKSVFASVILKCARIAHLQTTPSKTISGVLHVLKNYVRWVLCFILSKRARNRILQSDWFLVPSGFSCLWPTGSRQRARDVCVKNVEWYEREGENKLFIVLGSVHPYSCGEKRWPQSWKCGLGLRPRAVFSRPRSHTVFHRSYCELHVYVIYILLSFRFFSCLRSLVWF